MEKYNFEKQRADVEEAFEWLGKLGKIKNIEKLNLEFCEEQDTGFGFDYMFEDQLVITINLQELQDTGFGFDYMFEDQLVITINLQELYELEQGALHSFFHEVGHFIQMQRWGEDKFNQVCFNLENDMYLMRKNGIPEENIEKFYRNSDIESEADDFADLLLEQFLMTK